MCSICFLLPILHLAIKTPFSDKKRYSVTKMRSLIVHGPKMHLDPSLLLDLFRIDRQLFLFAYHIKRPSCEEILLAGREIF